MSIIILPIILIVLGLIGVIGTVWVSGSFKARETTISKGSEWFSISPEVLESELTMRIREHFRNLLKALLIWMIGWYRKISKEITVKQVLKKQVRTFLYDHTPEGIRHPSDFWHRVRHDEKKSLKNKRQDIAPEELISGTIEKEE